MKKWMGVIMMAVMAAFTFTAQAAIVDEWDMNGNGTWQNSNNGLNLGGHYSDANQAVAQVADDGTFNFSPSPAYDPDGSKFSGVGPLSSTNSLVDNVIRLSWAYTSMDWTTSAAAAQGVGFRIYNAAQSEYVGLELREFSGKIWAYAKSSANLGNLSEKTGRLINGLAGSGRREVSVELDYANSEIRVYTGPEWDYSSEGNDGVFIYPVDFATAGVADIGAFQTYFANWGATNVTTFDNLRIETLPVQSAQSDVHVVSQLTTSTDNTPSTNTFSFYANEGDMVVVMSASNKGADPSTNSVTFSGGAVLDETVYNRRNNGPTTQYWYVPVLSNGTVNAEYVCVNSLASVAAYQLRGITDEGVVVLAEAKDGIGSAGTTSITNSYAWEKSDSGIFLEAYSTYGTDGTPLNPAAVVDVSNSTDKRIVAHGAFSSTNELVNIWNHTTLTNVSIVGLAVQSDRIPETDDLITYKLDDPAGTDIKDLEQVGIDDNSFSGLGDGIQADGAGNLVYSNCATSTYRTHDFEKAVTNGVLVLEFKVSDWDYTGMPDGTGVGFSLINTNNGDTAKISFDFKPGGTVNGTRIAFVGEGDADYGAKLNVTNGTDVAMRLRIDLDNDQYDAQYNVGNGWITQSITNDLGFAEGVVTRLQLVQNTAAWVAGAYVKVDYVKVAQANARLVDFQLDDEVGTLFGQAYNPGTWDGAAWNFNGPWATDGAGNLRFDLTAVDGGSTRKFINGTSLSNGVVNARWSVPAWDFLDGDGAMGVQWQLRDTNSLTGVKIQFDQNGTSDASRVRGIDSLGTGKQKTFASGTLTNSTDGVDFRVRLDLDEGTLNAYWKYSADTSWTLIDATLTNGITQLDEIWVVSTAPTGLGDAGYCDYDYFIVDYTPGGGSGGVTVVPNITGLIVSGATVSLTWDSESGVSYNVLSKAALTNATWSAKASAVPGAGASTSTDVTGSGTEEFYTIEAYTP